MPGPLVVSERYLMNLRVKYGCCSAYAWCHKETFLRIFCEDVFFHFVLNKSILLEFFVCFVFFVVSSLRLTLMIGEVLR